MFVLFQNAPQTAIHVIQMVCASHVTLDMPSWLMTHARVRTQTSLTFHAYVSLVRSLTFETPRFNNVSFPYKVLIAQLNFTYSLLKYSGTKMISS